MSLLMFGILIMGIKVEFIGEFENIFLFVCGGLCKVFVFLGFVVVLLCFKVFFGKVFV